MVGAIAAGVRVEWSWAVFHEILYWAVWAALTPLILSFARRHRLDAGEGWRPWAAHAGLALVIAPFHIGVTYLLHAAALVGVGALPPDRVGAWLADRRTGFLVIGLTGLWKYAMVVGAWYAIDYYLRWRREREQAAALELRTARLASDLTRSRLAALRSQLHPHFLFNTLNSISVLTEEEPARANRMVLRLADLLRATLERDGADLVSLGEELELLNRYLEVQEARYEERLRVVVDAPPDAREIPVPHLVLQPLVENAIRHGIDRDPEGGTIRVEARVEAGRLLLVVEDRPASPAGERESRRERDHREGTGIGLANTRERLRRLYRGEAELDAAGAPGGGFRVSMRLPARAGPPAMPMDEPPPRSAGEREG